ncbi:hypothetical protein ABZ825_39460 [Streptomyces tauricus]|uniref:hypothetical protein n=1 Tax=Streptomyces tauricus TaxID=68274 RepID=UPI0033E8E6D9
MPVAACTLRRALDGRLPTLYTVRAFARGPDADEQEAARVWAVAAAAVHPAPVRQPVTVRARGTTAPEPDLSTMEYVRRWFTHNLPALAGAVTSLVIHPVVGHLVEAAGGTLAEEFRHRFGSEGDA